MCSHSVVKWHEIYQTFAMSDYVRKTTAKKSFKYRKYRLLEPFLTLGKFRIDRLIDQGL